MNTRFNGKTSMKCCAVLFMLTVAIFALTSCPGFSDWDYTLQNDYLIVKVNSEDICVCKGSQYRVERFVVAFCYDDTYIGIQRIPIDLPWNADIDTNEFDYSTLEYYLIDSENDEVFGPYSEEEYNQKCSELGITELCDWISTLTRPKGAK